MNKPEFVAKVTEWINSQDIRKPVSSKKNTFHITDDQGNSTDFIIKTPKRTVRYTQDDVFNIITACVNVANDCMKEGEPVNLLGLGTLYVKYMAPRVSKDIFDDDKWYDVPGRYVPKFKASSVLKTSVKVYEMALDDEKRKSEPEPVYDEYDEEEMFNDVLNSFKTSEPEEEDD